MRAFHPPFDRLRAFADGENADATPTAAHLRSCTECRGRVAALRERRTQLREATTLPPPPGAWERILARREAGEELLLPTGPVPLAVPEAPANRRTSLLRRAAVLLLGVAGIASATVPGSPLRAWLGSVFTRPPAEVPAAGTAPAPAPADVPLASVERGPEAGIAVRPDDTGEVRVVVEDAGPALHIRIRLTDTRLASARGRGAALEAIYANGHGRITVTGAAGGELEVRLPRTARRASLTVDGRRYVVLEGGHLTVLVPADSSGAEVIFPGRP